MHAWTTLRILNYGAMQNQMVLPLSVKTRIFYQCWKHSNSGHLTVGNVRLAVVERVLTDNQQTIHSFLNDESKGLLVL